MRRTILEKFKEAILSVLPLAVLVVILMLSMTDISGFGIGLFAFGTIFLIIGMALFTLGADVAMMPMGNSVGSFLSKTPKKRFWIVALVCLVIGFVITIAEPDLQVLAEQLSNKIIIYTVAAGVAIFLLVSVFKTFFNIKLKYILLFFYAVVFALAVALHFVNPQYLAAAFDSGGVTTGPITVPFLMALGIGIASVRGARGQDDSFGMIALCSVGPIIAVMVLGLTGASELSVSETPAIDVSSMSGIFKAFGEGLKLYLKDVSIALLPVIGVFFIFQFVALRLPKTQVIRIIAGIVYTYVGLTIFLTGVHVGFMPIGQALGTQIATKSYKYILIPIGMVMGALIVLAEPAIHVLNKQVEEVTGGSISKRVMLIALCAGIAVSVGLAMLRVLTGVSIWWFVVPVYAISLLLMFFVPTIFTGIAFDSGGVASGPMTATFLLPMAIGACQAIGGNVFTDAYGLVAFVAMTPLITIQLVGLIFKLKTRRLSKKDILRAQSNAPVAAQTESDAVVEFDIKNEESVTDEQNLTDAEDNIYSDLNEPDTQDTVEFD